MAFEASSGPSQIDEIISQYQQELAQFCIDAQEASRRIEEDCQRVNEDYRRVNEDCRKIEEDCQRVNEDCRRANEDSQSAKKTCKEIKEALGSLRQELKSVQDRVGDCRRCGRLDTRDPGYMNRIQVRHLLNTAQDKLAMLLDPKPFIHQSDRSLVWRQWAQGQSLSALRTSLEQAPSSGSFHQLISSDKAMKMLIEPSVYRTECDQVAHPAGIVSESAIRKAVEAVAESDDKATLLLMVDCLWKY